MSGTIIPLTPPPARTALAPATPPAALPAWGAPPPPPAQKTPQLQRVLSVFGRFKWLILGLTVLGTVAGVVATRFVEPQYEATATILIRSESPMMSGRDREAPAQAAELLSAAAWIPLFQSGAVSDEVVRQLGLYLQPERAADSVLFRGFQLADDGFRTGDFELSVSGNRVRLQQPGTALVEEVAVGDSVGRRFGFRWRPDPAQLRAGRTVQFTVVHPREAGIALNRRLRPQPRDQTFLLFTLSGEDPQRTAHILEQWLRRFVTVAGELKRAKLVEQANIQMENLRRAEENLRQSTLALQQFKVGAITLPSEGTAVAAGVQETQPTVLTTFFQQRQRLEDLRAVRASVERILADARRSGALSDEDLFELTSLTTGANNIAITKLVNELHDMEASRRAELRVWTDTAPRIQELDRQIARQRNLIVTQTNALLAQVRQEERDLAGRLANAESELRDIPLRSTREADLERDVAVNAQLYTALRASAEQAQLAAATALPDVDVLDWPVPPLRPSKNTIPQILAVAILGSLAFGVALALLIDRVDQRFRYPEQAKDDLGLDILGAVPRLRSAHKGGDDPEEGAQVLEAFRLLRLNVRHALDGAAPIALTVSSAAASDGKSLVSSNLAVSFALAGYRVLLVDGDIRRGSLHAAFGAPQRPGLADVLAGDAARDEALRPTAQANLTLLPCGTRSRRAPELLASSAMVELLAQLRGTFDVIIVDSPPLSAGIDASALSMATGAMLFVIRAGRTNMRLARAKLADLDRLPVFVPGAVLNGITPKGIYEYYSYDYGYAADDEPETANGALPTSGGSAPQLPAEATGDAKA